MLSSRRTQRAEGFRLFVICKSNFPLALKNSNHSNHSLCAYSLCMRSIKIYLLKNDRYGVNCKKVHTVLKFGKFRTENGNRKDRKWKLSWSSSISFGISKRWKLKKLSGLWKQNRRCSFYQIRFGPDQELSLHNTTKTILAIWIFKNLIFGFFKVHYPTCLSRSCFLCQDCS